MEDVTISETNGVIRASEDPKVCSAAIGDFGALILSDFTVASESGAFILTSAFWDVILVQCL